MKIFYTASYYGKAKYQTYYDLVGATIKKFKVELISTEEGNYQDVLEKGTRARIIDPNTLHYEAVRQGIHEADAVVIEISNQDFQLGHEATLAIAEKKPVLCLSLHEDMSQKINNPYFFGAKYDEQHIEGILQDFFARVRELRLAQRFNMFLYPTQVSHLEKQAKKYGMNMSEYIRRLINLDRRESAASETRE